MKETILITGAGPNGITGKSISEKLSEKYSLLTPGSKDLDLTQETLVGQYLASQKVDYIVHCATYRPEKDTGTSFYEELDSNLRMFFSLASHSDKYKKMIYLGSGAEFDKSRAIVEIEESEFGKRIPKNNYGFAKYIMNSYARQSKNIINFRLFGTINKYERPTKNIISNICVKALQNAPIHLIQDCKFSFFPVDDIPPLMEYAFHNDLLFKDYNLVLQKKYYLSEIAGIIIDTVNSKSSLSFERPGLNLEYTGSAAQLEKELKIEHSTIQVYLAKVCEYIQARIDNYDLNSIDNRWK